MLFYQLQIGQGDCVVQILISAWIFGLIVLSVTERVTVKLFNCNLGLS